MIPRVRVFTSVRDEEYMMPFFLRHYARIADQIIVRDYGSTDGTRQIVSKCSKTILQEFKPHPIDEKQRLAEAYEFVTISGNSYDWCIVVDCDEFIVGDFNRAISEASLFQLIRPDGYNMVGLPPVDDGHSQIYELHNKGVPSGVYSKPVVIRSGLRSELDYKWSYGRHDCVDVPVRIMQGGLRLLHFRYLGGDYTKSRNARNYDRCGEDKGPAWTCAPDYTGEHSATWAAALEQGGADVVTGYRIQYLHD